MEELYQLDPSLKEIAGLEDIIRQLRDHDSPVLDTATMADIRRRVLEYHAAKQHHSSDQFSMTYRILLAATGTLLIAVLVVGGGAAYITYQQDGVTQVADRDISISLARHVTARGPEAFGSLGEIAAEEGLVRPSAAQAEMVGFGGGGTTPAPELGAADSRMMIAPWPTYQYAYTYAGDAIDVPAVQPVYKRVIDDAASQRLARAFGGTASGIIDLEQSYQLESVHLRGVGQSGTSVSINFDTGQASMYRYQEDEPSVQVDRSRPVTPLSDERLLQLATEAITSFGVDPAAYGDPVIDTRWRDQQEQSDAPVVPPDYQTVLFPITFDSEVVYERDGSFPTGVAVQIDQRRARVDSIWGVTAQQYESSEYTVVTDEERLRAMAEMGGMNAYRYAEGEEVNELVVTLGTPEVVYIQYTRYQEAERRSEELYVPVLRFPVVSIEESDDVQPWMYRPQYVTVPLIGEMVDELESRGDTSGQPEPLPLPRPLPVEPGPAVDPAVSVIEEL